MIYTVTLNPALDRTIWIDKFQFDDTCRIVSEERYPGGKGVDVSRIIKTLGGESVALGFIGGFDGLEFQGRLLNEGIPHDFIRIGGETRTNIIIHAENTDHELKVNAAGPEIKPEELGMLIEKIKKLRPAPSFAVISGSIPPGLSKGIYRQMTLAFESLGAKVVLDADGESLEKGLPATPFMIKPNTHELRRVIGREFESKSDMIKQARTLINEELEIVVVSAGPDGVYVVLKDGGFHVTTPDIPVKNSVGAGDSLIGGIVYELDRGGSLEDAVVLGVACGTATAMSEGTAQGTKEDIDMVLPDIGVKELPE